MNTDIRSTFTEGQGDSEMTPEAQAAVYALAKYIVDRATKSALDVVSTCAADGCQKWRLFFDAGLADAIAEDTETESDFFQRLCGKFGLPHSACIIDTYLSQLPSERVKKLFEISNLKRKAHPANMAFYGASFISVSGGYFLDILRVFVKHGLTPDRLDIVASRCFPELERACNLGHMGFIRTIIPMLTHFPEELAQSIVSRSAQADNVIALLVNKCDVPISVFTDPKVMISAKPEVSLFITALDARSRREPERELTTVEEEHHS